MTTKNPTKKFNLSKAGQIVRIKAQNNTFEIVTNRGKVTSFRQGQGTLEDVLASETVFFDAKKGNVASNELVMNALNLESIQACLESIVRNGTLEKSTEERAAEMEAKTNAICYYINKNYVEPKTKIPHPMERLIRCMKDVKFRVDVSLETPRQAEAAVKKMRGNLMFTQVEALSGKLTVHVTDAPKVESITKNFGSRKANYGGTNATFEFSMSQAQFNSMTEQLNKKLAGNYQLTIDQGGVAPEQPVSKKKKKKKGRN